MGRIVATPTAGSAGILPAVLVHALDSGKFTKEQLTIAMFTASALGLVIANKASISGAAGGCQASEIRYLQLLWQQVHLLSLLVEHQPR